MILGIGNDLTDIRRIEKSLARFGARFEERIFTDTEQKKARTRQHPAATYAKRFAAKEACAKALGLGMQQGVAWRDIEVVNDAHGKPQLHLHGAALERLKTLTPQNMRASLHLTLSDEYPMAQAYVVIEAL